MELPERPSSRGEEGGIQALFVKRLERLIRLRSHYREDLNPLGLLLLDRAIDATYQDCIDFGVADKARILMAGRKELGQTGT
jgi:hypothetical protein